MTEFKKEKIAMMQKISTEILNDLTVNVGFQDDDFLKNRYTVELSAAIYAHTAEERELVYYFDKPTFSDWLLRRRRVARFKLLVKDLLCKAPEIPDTLRTYEVTNY